MPLSFSHRLTSELRETSVASHLCRQMLPHGAGTVVARRAGVGYGTLNSCGGRNLSDPSIGCAYGTPRNCVTEASEGQGIPWISPSGKLTRWSKASMTVSGERSRANTAKASVDIASAFSKKSSTVEDRDLYSESEYGKSQGNYCYLLFSFFVSYSSILPYDSWRNNFEANLAGRAGRAVQPYETMFSPSEFWVCILQQEG